MKLLRTVGPEQESEIAKPDPNAKGSGPEAFTVPGHSVFIDVRNIHSQKPPKKDRGEEAPLRRPGAEIFCVTPCRRAAYITR